MCMHRLKYARLNRKERLKNMRGMTLEVAMLANVSGNVCSCTGDGVVLFSNESKDKA